MNAKNSISLAFLFFVGVVLFSSSAYRLNEWQQAIIIQLGKPVRDTVKDAGLHFRIPFIETVERVDKRILNWDGNPNQIPTKDKKYIDVDTTARWIAASTRIAATYSFTKRLCLNAMSR